ncbi:MAG: hypothetical protein HQK75_05490 [Candidatus Magnetomorum sp.]|nr:hypothetical protein [Candidatus Magnetomorum sp.]
MANKKRTFSESWHRVASLRISLLPTVDIRKQYFRGEAWYILNNPFNNQFFRLRPEAYAFIARLNAQRSVEHVWNECLERFPDTAPGQEDVIQLLTQLYNANLLYFHSRPDTSQIFERYQKRQQKELQSKLMSILFMRLPLFDPDRLLSRCQPIWRLLVSPLGAIIWLAVVIGALKVFIDHRFEAFNQMQGILAPGNLAFLYCALVLIKTMHEIAHAVVCRRFGGEVHILGLMLLVFTPLPYMDATSSWTFRNRWHRMLVGAAGILMEIFLAALSVFAWANTGQGALHALFYNVMFIASVSTLLFNANPLLRFDGYYILSDLLDIPNLHSRSKEYLNYLVERYAFGSHETFCPTQRINESFTLGLFGILSLFYRLLIFAGIILFVADKFLILGLIMAVIGIISWCVVPVFKFLSYLISSPMLRRNRVRVLLVTGSVFATVISLLLFIPFDDSLQAPGVIEAEHFQKIYSDHPGYVEKLFKPSGSFVQSGELLIQLKNKEIEFDLATAELQRKETLVMIKQARNVKIVDLKPLIKRLEKVETDIADLKGRMMSLFIKSKHAGIWQASQQARFSGRWIQRGGELGEVIDPGLFLFSAAVPQEEASRLFQGEVQDVSVKIKGEAHHEIPVRNYQVIPFEQSKLPSIAIGWSGGGQIATSFQDNTGLLTQEPFFLIIANLSDSTKASLFHGRSGRINMVLPSKPLYYQLYRSVKQLFQKRYLL